MSNKAILFSIIAVAVLAFFYGVSKYPDIKASYFDAPEISEQTVNHILIGDERGGGHQYGAGKPCKSEFPEDWDEAAIIEAVKQVAANDNLDWKQGDNGYYAADQEVDGVMVRVVLNGERSHVVTGYPIGSERNDCPERNHKNHKPRAAANDNNRRGAHAPENADGDESGYVVRQNFNKR